MVKKVGGQGEGKDGENKFPVMRNRRDKRCVSMAEKSVRSEVFKEV